MSLDYDPTPLPDGVVYALDADRAAWVPDGEPPARPIPLHPRYRYADDVIEEYRRERNADANLDGAA